MWILKAHRESLGWDFKGMGLFEATIWDGKITDVRFFRKGSNVTSEVLWASNGCEEFLKFVYQALGDLLEHIESGRNRLND